VLLIRGEHRGIFDQHVPVPIGMWKPLSGSGVPLNASGPWTLSLTRKRVAPLICYKQFLVLPVLAAMAQHPSVLVAVSNLEWLSSHRLGRQQDRLMHAWSQLFSIALVTARNGAPPR
jgi:hypothetical protein